MTPTAEPASTALTERSAAIPAGLLGDGEQIVLALKPSGWFLVLASLPFCAGVGALGIAAWLADGFGFAVPLKLVAGWCAAACALRVVIAGLQWLARVYVLTDRRVLRVKGVLRPLIFQCALERIQHTSLSFSVPQRVLGLGTVLFATAGTGTMEAAWEHLARPVEVHEVVLEYVRRAQSGRRGDGVT